MFDDKEIFGFSGFENPTSTSHARPNPWKFSSLPEESKEDSIDSDDGPAILVDLIATQALSSPSRSTSDVLLNKFGLTLFFILFSICSLWYPNMGQLNCPYTWNQKNYK